VVLGLGYLLLQKFQKSLMGNLVWFLNLKKVVYFL